MSLAEDRRRLSFRLTVLQWSTVGIFTALAMSFWFLQVVQHARYEEMAENNHQRTLAMRAPRGVLFDRNGKVLVQNREALNISLVREGSRDVDQSVRMLAAVTGVEEKTVREVVDRNRNLPRYRPLM